MSKPEITESVKVTNIKESLIPNIYIVELQGRNLKIDMDIHREVLVFGKNDSLKLIISKTKPQYQEGKDFCAKGIVANKKTEDKNKKIIISLWGFTVIITDKEQKSKLWDKLNIMDEVYYCLNLT